MVVVAVVNGVLVALALGTWSGLETVAHYQKGLDYNRDLAGARAQAALGWRVDFRFTPGTGPGHGGELAVSFEDKNGRPLEALDVNTRILRPTQAGLDKDLALVHRGGGRYAARLEVPLAGQWTVRVHAYGGPASYQMSRRIQVP